MGNKNIIVTGLGFGDETKGATTDFLAKEHNADYVVKFSGGAQTAHNVVYEDGREHTFAQFGSATMRGVKTLITEHVMVNPFNMAAEADALWGKTGEDPFNKTFISESALLTTPIHVAANQQREINRGKSAHGSCGLGIGETMGYAIKHPILGLRVLDLKIPGYLEAKLDALRINLERELGEFDLPDNGEIIAGYEALREDRPFNIVSDTEIYRRLNEGVNIFEGTQGVLLDQDYGFHPHTTWCSVTSQNAQKVLQSAKLPRGKVVGVTRSYSTRHGFGPFPSEFANTDWMNSFPENHNAWGQFQGAWRGGALDLVLLNYAVRANGGVDEIALSHLDYPYQDVVVSYDNFVTELPVPTGRNERGQQSVLTERLLNPELVLDTTSVNGEDELIQFVEFATGAPVTIKAYGARDVDRIHI